jgi:hypothetical protein
MVALLIRELLMASKTFGIKTAARMAMTASTPIISISVKPCVWRLTAGVLTVFIFMVLRPLSGVYLFVIFVLLFFVLLLAAVFSPAIFRSF